MNKKALVVFFLFFAVTMCIILLVGCNQKYVLRENVEESFADCYIVLERVANAFDKTVGDTIRFQGLPMETAQGEIRKAFSIIIDEGSYIEVLLQYRNLRSKPERGEETITLTYYVNSNNHELSASETTFNLDFFAALIKAVSREDVTKEDLSDFLLAPENKYPASKYGFYKMNEEKKKKIAYLNPGSDWARVQWGLAYYQRADSSYEFCYFGPVRGTS